MRVIKGAFRALLLALVCFALYVGIVFVTGNFHTVIRGQLYRSGQPSAEQIANWHERYGINTIINLRGAQPNTIWYRAERAATEECGVKLIDYKLSAKRELTRAQTEELLAMLAQASHQFSSIAGMALIAQVSFQRFYVAVVAHSSEFFAELQLTPLYGHIPLWFMPYYAMDRSFENAEMRLGFPDS